jgi:hypothetical protein
MSIPGVVRLPIISEIRFIVRILYPIEAEKQDPKSHFGGIDTGSRRIDIYHHDSQFFSQGARSP